MKYSHLQTTIFASAISFLLLYSIFYFIFVPALKQSRLLSRQIKEQKITWVKKEVPAKEYRLWEDQIREKREEMKMLKNQLIWDDDHHRFLNKLVQLASGLQMEFVFLKPESEPSPLSKTKEKPELTGLFKQTHISVTVASNYTDLVEFLKRIEKADKFMRLDALIIESKRDSIHKHNIKLNLCILNEL